MAARLFAGLGACCAKTITGWRRLGRNARLLFRVATRGRSLAELGCRRNRQMVSGAVGLANLERLAAQVRRDLSAIEVPPAEWMRPRPAPDGRPAVDVVVV